MTAKLEAFRLVVCLSPAASGANCATAAAEPVMPQLSKFIPALHHSLVKVRANPPPELSAGVERQAREYFMGLKDGKVWNHFVSKFPKVWPNDV